MESDSQKTHSEAGYYNPQRCRCNSDFLQSSVHQNAYRKTAKKNYRKKNPGLYSIAQLLSFKDDSKSILEPIGAYHTRKLILLNKDMQITWRFVPKVIKSDLDAMTKSLKSLLNKLTPTNFDSIKEKISDQITRDSSLTFSNLLLAKACLEVKYSETYSKLSKELIAKHPFFRGDLLEACQKIFESQALNAEDASLNKKKVLGCVAFIGHLVNLRIISGKVTTLCCNQLLKKNTEETAEGVCYLLSTCSGLFSSSKFKEIGHDLISELQKKCEVYSARFKFQVQDLIEDRKIHAVIFQNGEKPRKLSEF